MAQSYFMFANHRYEIVRRGFTTAKEADEYSRKHYGGFAQYKKLTDGKYVLGVRRTPMRRR
ncbi:hypothetical protein LCGC14_0510340 [marine sediment metagenome]|uniref:Uncharacterized protein n=1 Tax=marine sediment metagenome TaxID=412755 RepID=A0A0F9V9U8_9ZZZZ